MHRVRNLLYPLETLGFCLRTEDEELKEEMKEMIDGVLPLIQTEIK